MCSAEAISILPLSLQDVLARRTRLAFLNANVALDVLPRVIDIMAEELRWDDARKKHEYARGFGFVVVVVPVSPLLEPDGSPLGMKTPRSSCVPWAWKTSTRAAFSTTWTSSTTGTPSAASNGYLILNSIADDDIGRVCRECFDAIDTEHKGHISKQKLKEFVKAVSEPPNLNLQLVAAEHVHRPLGRCAKLRI